MGVASTTNRVPYIGDGSTLTFAFSYYFTLQTDLIVYRYDTLLGGVTLCVLGIHYTISGTVNAQGIYPSGANVVFGTAPLSTDIVVIFRDPARTQSYALLQNGSINSLALVQQLDYLTLLVQRLEDQVSRAVLLPDGLGATFNSILPSKVALSPATVPTVNQAGNGFDLIAPAQATPWQKATVLYGALSAAGLSNSVQLFTLQPGYALTGIQIKHSASFTGAAVSAVSASVGIAGDTTKFIDQFDVMQTVTDSAFDGLITSYIASWANNTAIELTGISVGANLNALTTGSVDVYYKVEKIIS